MSDRAMPVRLIALEEVVAACDQLARAVLESDFQPDTVVAIARGGFMPARFLCDFLSISTLMSIKVRHYDAGGQSAGDAVVDCPLGGDVAGRSVLLVDDVNDSGETLRAALPYIRDLNPSDLRSAVLHEKGTTACPADFAAELMSEWRWVLYPWAVVEDAGQFIRELEPLPATRDAIRDALQDKHGLTLSPDQLDRVIRYNRLPVSDGPAC